MVIADGAHAEGGREVAEPAAKRTARTEVDKVVAGAELLDHAAPQRCAAVRGAAQPMALARLIGELMEKRVGREFAVEDDERCVGELGPQRLGAREFAVAEGADREAGEEMAAQDHQRHDAHHGIAPGALPARADAAEGGLVLRRVRHAQGAAIEAEDSQPAPAFGVGGSRSPHGGTLSEERGERRGPEAFARLSDGTAAHGLAAPADGQHQVEMPHDLPDRAIAQQRHADHEPDDVLGGQLASADRRGSRRRQRLRNPFRIERFAEELEARRAVVRPDGEQCLPHPHRPTSVGETNYTLWMRRSRIRALTALSDRHCR